MVGNEGLTPTESWVLPVRDTFHPLQFTFGVVDFGITSPVNLFRGGELMGHWEEGKWPDAAFYDMMNTEIVRCEVKTDRLIVIADSDQYECMQIVSKAIPPHG